MDYIRKWLNRIKNIDFIGILLGVFILFMIIVLIKISYTFFCIFNGREIPITLGKWSEFSEFFSAIIALANLIVFTFLTVKADLFQKKLIKKQSNEETIRSLTKFRIEKLEDMEGCIEYYLKISSTQFSNKQLWKTNLSSLYYKIDSFRTSAEELFGQCDKFSDLIKIEEAIENLKNEVDNIDYNSFNTAFKKTNNDLLTIRADLFKYTYAELNK